MSKKKVNGTGLQKNEPAIKYEHGDSSEILEYYIKEKHLFDLVVTSPPYNVGKEYESKRTIEDYLEEQKKIIQQIVSVVKPTGSICWQVGNYINNKTKEVFPLDMFYYQIFKDL